MKICKQLLQKHGNNWAAFKSGLLEWRNVPRPSGLSPAQLMFGRTQKTCLPRLEAAHKVVDVNKATIDRVKRDHDMKQAFDKHALLQPALAVGENVLTQDVVSRKWDRQGLITECLPNGRSYIIEFQDGSTLRRNRRFLRKL